MIRLGLGSRRDGAADREVDQLGGFGRSGMARTRERVAELGAADEHAELVGRGGDRIVVDLGSGIRLERGLDDRLRVGPAEFAGCLAIVPPSIASCDFSLPPADFGPVERAALSRFASICRSVAMISRPPLPRREGIGSRPVAQPFYPILL